MKKKIKNNPMKETAELLSTAIGDTYDTALIKSIETGLIDAPKIIGYRTVDAPRHLVIWLPMVRRHYDYEYGDFLGWLISLEPVIRIPIGTKKVREPIIEEKPVTQKKIKFKRYGDLKAEFKKWYNSG